MSKFPEIIRELLSSEQKVRIRTIDKNTIKADTFIDVIDENIIKLSDKQVSSLGVHQSYFYVDVTKIVAVEVL